MAERERVRHAVVDDREPHERHAGITAAPRDDLAQPQLREVPGPVVRDLGGRHRPPHDRRRDGQVDDGDDREQRDEAGQDGEVDRAHEEQGGEGADEERGQGRERGE